MGDHYNVKGTKLWSQLYGHYIEKKFSIICDIKNYSECMLQQPGGSRKHAGLEALSICNTWLTHDM